MSFFQLKTLRSKFVVTLSIGVLAFVVIFALALDSLRSIEESYARMRESAMAGRIAALEISKDINFLSRLTRAIMLGGDFDKELKNVDTAIAAVNKNFDALEGKPFTPESKALIAKARSAAQDFMKTARDLVLPLKNVPPADRPAIYGEYEKKATPSAMAFREHFGNFEKSMVALADSSMSELSERMAARRTTLWISFAGAILLVYVAGYLLTNSDLRAMRRCVEFAEALGGPTPPAPLDPARSASLALLAQALNGTAASLSAFKSQAEAARQEAQKERDEVRKALEETRLAQQRAEAARREGQSQAAAGLGGVISVIDKASEELLDRVEHCRADALDQARRAETTAAAMDQMNASVLDVARSSSNAARTAGTAMDKAREGAAVAGQVIEGIGQVRSRSLELKQDMGNLGKQAQGIGSVLGVISDIADQTNLLALNAAIEAARAGDAGRGFAVVADEVRKLAEKTMTATKEVGQAVQDIQEGARRSAGMVDRAVETIAQATELAERSGSTLDEIVSLAGEAAHQISAIAAAAEEQSSASGQVNRSMDEVSAITVRTSESLVQASGIVHELSEQARVLRGLVGEMQA